MTIGKECGDVPDELLNQLSQERHFGCSKLGGDDDRPFKRRRSEDGQLGPPAVKTTTVYIDGRMLANSVQRPT